MAAGGEVRVVVGLGLLVLAWWTWERYERQGGHSDF